MMDLMMYAASAGFLWLCGLLLVDTVRTWRRRRHMPVREGRPYPRSLGEAMNGMALGELQREMAERRRLETEATQRREGP